MSSAKRLNDFLPTKQDTTLAQAKIPTDLHQAVRDQMARDRDNKIRIDWTVLIEAACRAYLAERKVKLPGGNA